MGCGYGPVHVPQVLLDLCGAPPIANGPLTASIMRGRVQGKALRPNPLTGGGALMHKVLALW